jgi:type III secretion protein F
VADLSLGTLSGAMQSQMGAAQSEMDSQMQNLAGKQDVSNADLLQMQYGLQKWSMTMQLQSTMVKDVGDALKGIVQKMG